MREEKGRGEQPGEGRYIMQVSAGVGGGRRTMRLTRGYFASLPENGKCVRLITWPRQRAAGKE